MPIENPDQEDEVLCHCSGTTRGELRRLSAQGMDMEAISRWTGALSGCGGCEWDITEFLSECNARKPDQDQT